MDRGRLLVDLETVSESFRKLEHHVYLFINELTIAERHLHNVEIDGKDRSALGLDAFEYNVSQTKKKLHDPYWGMTQKAMEINATNPLLVYLNEAGKCQQKLIGIMDPESIEYRNHEYSLNAAVYEQLGIVLDADGNMSIHGGGVITDSNLVGLQDALRQVLKNGTPSELVGYKFVQPDNIDMLEEYRLNEDLKTKSEGIADNVSFIISTYDNITFLANIDTPLSYITTAVGVYITAHDISETYKEDYNLTRYFARTGGELLKYTVNTVGLLEIGTVSTAGALAGPPGWATAIVNNSVVLAGLVGINGLIDEATMNSPDIINTFNDWGVNIRDFFGWY